VGKRVRGGLEPAPARSLQGWNYRMRLRNLENQDVDADTFRARTLFLNFWATWCAPCVAELPSIGRLMERVAGTDVACACGSGEPLETVKAFATRRKMKLKLPI